MVRTRGYVFERPRSEPPPATDAAAWIAGLVPDDWFTEPPEVTVDREEIVVVGRRAGGHRVRRGPGAAESAGSPSSGDHPERRIALARQIEHRYQRKAAWGAVCGGTRQLFTTLAAPVMTRLRQPERRVLDTLVDAGVARSRSEALAWCVRLVGKHTQQWLDELRDALSAVDELRRRGLRPGSRLSGAPAATAVPAGRPRDRQVAVAAQRAGRGRSPRTRPGCRHRRGADPVQVLLLPSRPAGAALGVAVSRPVVCPLRPVAASTSKGAGAGLGVGVGVGRTRAGRLATGPAPPAAGRTSAPLLRRAAGTSLAGASGGSSTGCPTRPVPARRAPCRCRDLSAPARRPDPVVAPRGLPARRTPRCRGRIGDRPEGGLTAVTDGGSEGVRAFGIRAQVTRQTPGRSAPRAVAVLASPPQWRGRTGCRGRSIRGRSGVGRWILAGGSSGWQSAGPG